MSNISLSGGTSANLTGTGGALAGLSNATTIATTIQNAIGSIETTLTGASLTPVLITSIQQVAPTTLPVTNGTVTLNSATLGLIGSTSSTALVVVTLPANLPSGTTVLIPSNITNPVIVVSGTENVTVYAQGTGTQNSVIYANSGNDFIFGDANDTLVGGSGQDTIGSLYGDASVTGGSGASLLFSGSFNDTMSGGAGNDTVVSHLYGGAGADSVNTGTGNDLVISRGSGHDTLVGGVGNDTFVGGSGGDSIVGAQGNNIIIGGSGNDTVIGGTGNDNLQGGAGNDSIVAGSGHDTLWGGSGTDTLVGGGGTAQDLFYISGAGAGSSSLIQNFSSSQGDQVDLVGVKSLVVGPASSATGTTAAVALSGANTVITMPDGSTVTLVGIASLPANSIIFG